MKPGSLTLKHNYAWLLLCSLLIAFLVTACGTLQVDLAPTPERIARPGVPITPTAWFGPAQYATEAGVIFDDRLKLVGYTVEPQSASPGSRVTVTLIWEVLGKIEADYNTFVHMFNEEDQLLAQSDRPTGGGYRLSRDWIIKEYVYDQHQLRLPGSMSLDDVEIRIGLYDFDGGQRLNVENPASYTLQIMVSPTPEKPALEVVSPGATETPPVEETVDLTATPAPDEADRQDPVPEATETPETEETAVPQVPLTVRVAYIKDANVWLWDADTGPAPLTVDGGVENVWLSDDGQYVAFIREQNIWVVDTEGGDERQLTRQEDFQGLNLEQNIAPFVTGIWPSRIAWRPDSHQLFFNTSPQVEGPGLFLSDDLWMVDADSAELSMILAPGEGGNAFFSPDGQKLAIVTPGKIDFVDAGGNNRREAFTHTPVITFSEFEYYAQPVWAPDSNSLRVAIPPADSSVAAGGPTSIWHIPVEDRPSWLVGQVTTLPGMHNQPLFAPNLARLAYLVAESPESDATGDLPDIAVSELSENVIWDPNVFQAEVSTLHSWSPDGIRLLFQSPTAALAEIAMGQPAVRPLISGEDQGLVIDVSWVDNFRFLYLQENAGNWNLLLGRVDGSDPQLVDFAPGRPYSYDFTWAPSGQAD